MNYKLLASSKKANLEFFVRFYTQVYESSFVDVNIDYSSTYNHLLLEFVFFSAIQLLDEYRRRHRRRLFFYKVGI